MEKKKKEVNPCKFINIDDAFVNKDYGSGDSRIAQKNSIKGRAHIKAWWV